MEEKAKSTQRTKTRTNGALTNGRSKNGTAKSNGNGVSSDVAIEIKGQLDAINAAFAFIEFDQNGIIQNANDIFLNVVGYKLKEVKGKHHRIFVHDDYAKSKEYEKFWKNLKNGEAISGEFLRKDKNGDDVWLLASYSPVRDHDGKILKVIKLGSDITAEKQAKMEAERAAEAMQAQEEELRQNLEEMSATQEEMQRIQRELETRMEQVDTACLVSESDLKGNITFVNDKFCEIAQYTREELIGQPHNIVRHPDSPKALFKEMWSTIGRGKIFRGVIKNRAKDGTPYWVDAIVAPVLGTNGKPVKYIGIRYDITEQVKKEEELKVAMQEAVDLRRKNEQTLEQAVDAIITIDELKNITFYNDSAVKMFGYSREEVMGQNVKMIVPMEHKASHDSYVDNNRETGVNKVIGTGRDLEMTRKDGSKFWGNLSLSRVEVDGQIHYTAFIKDITKQKHNELGFEEVIKAIGEITAGNFEFEMKTENLKMDDSLKQVITDLKNFKVNIKGMLAEVNNVIKSAGFDGNLNSRLTLENARGEWKNLVEYINKLIQSLADPMLEFNAIISQMAEGDLTQRFRMNAKGDIKTIADALNTALENMGNLILSITTNAEVIAQSSVRLIEKSEGIKNNSGEVAAAIAQMAKGAQDQALKTDESSKLVEDVLQSAIETEGMADIINSTAEDGQQKSVNGLKTVKALVENMADILKSANMTSDSIEILTRRADEIGRTLNVITDIASQTNLLALNAAIEAARAGDAGRGFAVVAEEIRKLAEDSRRSAVDIEKIIADVQKDTQSAGKAIDKMSESVDQGNKATNEVESIFQEITSSSQKTLAMSQDIRKSTTNQKSSIDTVVKNIEQIVVVAEETSSGTEEMASSSRELDQSMEEIIEASNQLSEIAASLQAGVNKFKLSK